MEFKKDIWRPLMVEAPAEAIFSRGSLNGFACRWLPGSNNLAFTADPFALWRGDRLYVFVEQFDYRTAHGSIAVYVFDPALNLLESREVLRAPWHLSYPHLVEHNDDIWMLPETHASGGQWIYRARRFPDDWEAVAKIDLPALDATPFRHGGRWWMLYAPASTQRDRLTHLHAASAPDLLGPWTSHRANPVLVDPQGARPAGPVMAHDGELILPV